MHMGNVHGHVTRVWIIEEFGKGPSLRLDGRYFSVLDPAARHRALKKADPIREPLAPIAAEMNETQFLVAKDQSLPFGHDRLNTEPRCAGTIFLPRFLYGQLQLQAGSFCAPSLHPFFQYLKH